MNSAVLEVVVSFVVAAVLVLFSLFSFLIIFSSLILILGSYVCFVLQAFFLILNVFFCFSVGPLLFMLLCCGWLAFG